MRGSALTQPSMRSVDVLESMLINTELSLQAQKDAWTLQAQMGLGVGNADRFNTALAMRAQFAF